MVHISPFHIIIILLDLYLISIFTYYFQVKEYRFDRFWSYLKEVGIVYLVFSERFYRPSLKKPRNILIIFIALFLTGSYFLFSTLFLGSIGLTILGVPLTIVFVGVGVLITAPLAEFKRGRIVNIAKNKLNSGTNVKFIGITGSFGKTSTKNYLHQLLSSEFPTAKTIKNNNTKVGVAISINQNLKDDTKYFVAEIGAYKMGEIKEVADFINPKYAILTAIGNQHLDLFGSRVNLINAKKELLKAIPRDGSAYVSLDFEEFDEMVEGLDCSVKTFSILNKAADAYVTDVYRVGERTHAKVHYAGQEFNIKLKLRTLHSLNNFLPCISLAFDLGISKEKIEKVCSYIKEDFTNLLEGLHKSLVIYDGYSSNVEGTIGAIERLNEVDASLKIVATKGIIELGSEKKDSYNKILDKVREYKMTLLTTDKTFKDLAGDEVIYFRGERGIFGYLDQNLTEDSALLIEGRFTGDFMRKMGISD
jgi:UDP-N-acetylmuramoyl-tripeptide--D-alanyl-D-alanine ligase